MKTDDSIAIRLSRVSKRYTIHHEKPTLVERLAKGRDEEFWALKDINLTIKKGEKVGIIGPNGSGKTTLLKIIAGITTPTSGTVETHGKIVSLIGIGAGFSDELTGVQNIYLNGLLLEIEKRLIAQKMNSIIAYADIKQFIDVSLFTYSSGMKLRLGFSIAVHSDTDILLLDEGLSFGDENFIKKARRTLFSKEYTSKTIMMVYHNPKLLQKQCTRTIIMKKGEIVFDGEVKNGTYEKYIK